MAPKATPGPEEQNQVAAGAAPPMTETPRKSALDALLNPNFADIIEPNPDREVVKGKARPANVVIHGPAQLEFSAISDNRLTRCAGPEHLEAKKVQRVYPKYLKSGKVIIIKPAPKTDLDATPVNRYPGASGAWINVITMLSEAGMTVESGWRERYDVGIIPKESPFFPGLYIDLGKRKERRLEPKKLSEEEKAEKAKQKAERQKLKAEKAAAAQAAREAKARSVKTEAKTTETED